MKKLLKTALIGLSAASMLMIAVFTATGGSASAGACDPADNDGNATCTESICMEDENGAPDCLVFEVCRYGSGQPPTIGACPASDSRGPSGLTLDQAPTRQLVLNRGR